MQLFPGQVWKDLGTGKIWGQAGDSTKTGTNNWP